MAGFMDMGYGALLVFATRSGFGLDTELWHLVVGVVFGVFPDLDIVPTILKGGKHGDHRVSVMHRPLIMMPIIGGLAYFVGDTFLDGGTVWAASALACLAWHYLHDTHLLSDGHLNAFWPITRKDRPSSPHEPWIREKWLRPSWRSALEVMAGAWSLALALWLTGHPVYAAAVVPIAVAGAYGVWALAPRYAL